MPTEMLKLRLKIAKVRRISRPFLFPVPANCEVEESNKWIGLSSLHLQTFWKGENWEQRRDRRV